MEQTLFFIGGLILGTASSISVARMQERHKVRVTLLREVLPLLGYSAYALNEEYVQRARELVTLAMVLTQSERSKAADLFEIYEERLNLPPLPGAINEQSATTLLTQKHEALLKRREEAIRSLRLALSKRLRWLSGLSEIEKKALEQ